MNTLDTENAREMFYQEALERLAITKRTPVFFHWHDECRREYAGSYQRVFYRDQGTGTWQFAFRPDSLLMSKGKMDQIPLGERMCEQDFCAWLAESDIPRPLQDQFQQARLDVSDFLTVYQKEYTDRSDFPYMSKEELLALHPVEVANLSPTCYFNQYLPAAQKNGLGYIWGGVLGYCSAYEPVTYVFNRYSWRLKLVPCGEEVGFWLAQTAFGMEFFLYPLALDKSTYTERLLKHFPQFEPLLPDLHQKLSQQDWDDF